METVFRLVFSATGKSQHGRMEEKISQTLCKIRQPRATLSARSSTLTGYDTENRPLRLQQCKETISRGGIDANEINDQTFIGLNFKDDKFELHPKGDDSWCMTQAHHPKPRERVFLQQCRRSRQHDTSLWEIY